MSGTCSVCGRGLIEANVCPTSECHDHAERATVAAIVAWMRALDERQAYVEPRVLADAIERGDWHT